MKVAASQFYPCNEVKFGSELFYLCELGKYLFSNGHVLGLDGVTINNQLRRSRYAGYLKTAYVNGWVVDIDSDFDIDSLGFHEPSLVKNVLFVENEVEFDKRDNDLRSEDYDYSITTPVMKQIFFAYKYDNTWVFSSRVSDSAKGSTNLSSIKDDLISQSFVSITAMVAVKRLLSGYPKSFYMSLDDTYLMIGLSFADMNILLEDTDALNGWFSVDTGADPRFSYEGWWFCHSDLGYLSRYISPSEKALRFKELGYYVGDVVFLFERSTRKKLDKLKSVTSCNYAIIKEQRVDGLVLDIFFTRNTKFGEQLKFESYPTKVKELYRDDTYKKCRHREQFFSWSDLGVDYYLYEEANFISSINKSDELTIDAVNNAFQQKSITLNCVNAIFWLLKDHEIEFDEEAYRRKYFGNSDSMYDLFVEGKL